jgi:hypothetical protein
MVVGSHVRSKALGGEGALTSVARTLEEEEEEPGEGGGGWGRRRRPGKEEGDAHVLELELAVGATCWSPLLPICSRLRHHLASRWR